MKSYPLIILFGLSLLVSGCKKDFLEAKPSTDLVSPSSLSDYQALLENVDLINRATPALLQMASDDYVFVDFAAWEGTFMSAERNSYSWAKDLFEGQKGIRDWNVGYSAIFICNNVLEGLAHMNVTDVNHKQWNMLRGRALFMRAYALYDLARAFAPAYDIQTATTDLGLPIRLKAEVDEVEPRASVARTYERILTDLEASGNLIQPGLEANNKTRPSKIAVLALLARICLDMRRYDRAELYADSTLSLYNTLIDYNTINPNESVPFSRDNAETILHSTVVSNFYNIVLVADYNPAVAVNPSLYNLYDENDLRKTIFFSRNPQTNNLFMRFGYAGPYGFPFTGLATDEVYLIKAECMVRRNAVSAGLAVLDNLLIKRYKENTYLPLTAVNTKQALDLVLLERRKELIFRSLRWTDLKRLNKEGANITVERPPLNGQVFTLPPNDPRYIFPIPDDEIALSGIQQNIR